MNVPCNTAISFRNLSEGFPDSAHMLGYLCKQLHTREYLDTHTLKTCKLFQVQGCVFQEEKARITVSILVVSISWISIQAQGCQIKSVQDDSAMNVPCKLCYLFQEYVRRFPSLGRNVQSIAQNNCLASVNAKKKSKRLQRTQNGYVSCKSNLRGAIHESLSQPQLSLPGVRQKVSLTQHVCPANCMLAAPNYCRKYIPENIKTLT